MVRQCCVYEFVTFLQCRFVGVYLVCNGSEDHGVRHEGVAVYQPLCLGKALYRHSKHELVVEPAEESGAIYAFNSGGGFTCALKSSFYRIILKVILESILGGLKWKPKATTRGVSHQLAHLRLLLRMKKLSCVRRRVQTQKQIWWKMNFGSDCTRRLAPHRFSSVGRFKPGARKCNRWGQKGGINSLYGLKTIHTPVCHYKTTNVNLFYPISCADVELWKKKKSKYIWFSWCFTIDKIVAWTSAERP